MSDDKVTLLMIGLPWYSAPDDAVYEKYFEYMTYLGALAERTIIRHAMGAEAFSKLTLPKLSPDPSDVLAEPSEEDYERLGRLQLSICTYSRTSLVGLSREMIAETAVMCNADYLHTWDADMKFPNSAFLRLWRHQQPIVSALAFTARDPVYPALFGVKWVDDGEGGTVYERSRPLFDYPKDRLVGDDDTDGWLASGGACTLVDVGVYRSIDQPWYKSTGAGEDWFFCSRAADAGIPRFVDTSLVAQHRTHDVVWIGEEEYWETRKNRSHHYEKQWGKLTEVPA